MTDLNAAVGIPQPARRLDPPGSFRSWLDLSADGGTLRDEAPASDTLDRLLPKITIVLVDRQRLFAEAIHSVLEHGGFVVLAVATTGEDGFRTVANTCPDITLVSLELPDMSGIDLGRALLEHCPPTKLVAVSTTTDPAAERRALEAGFSACVSKQVGPADLLRFIRSIADGRAVPAKQPVTNHTRSWSELLGSQLTVREREVLALLAEGASGRMIARRLEISENTVRTHVQNLLTKLQVGSRIEAVAYAVRHGLVERAAR
jgi:DNA-binding NarL/FixJ family response regulator